MLREELEIAFISKITGLSEREILRLKAELLLGHFFIAIEINFRCWYNIFLK
jgi:hypothetical protein